MNEFMSSSDNGAIPKCAYLLVFYSCGIGGATTQRKALQNNQLFHQSFKCFDNFLNSVFQKNRPTYFRGGAFGGDCGQ